MLDEQTPPPVERPKPGRQTLSFLRQLMQAHGIQPKNKLGQNFLIDLNLIDFAVKEAAVTRDDMVLEVGTGAGSLTNKLAEYAGAVLSVEIDPAFHALARETLTGQHHVRLVHADILKNKNTLNPEVLDQLRQGWERFTASEASVAEAGAPATRQEKRLKLVANLPYAVATPVISNFLMTDLPFERFVVTVQWEIAERLIAAPGTKDYGALAILVQSLADVDLLRRLPPAVFWPRPKVDSAIVRIWPRARKRAQIPDLARFRVFLRDLYAHRRKNLRGSLVGLPGKPWDKATVDAKLAELGIDGAVRAETLDRQTHLRLCEAFTRRF